MLGPEKKSKLKLRMLAEAFFSSMYSHRRQYKYGESRVTKMLLNVREAAEALSISRAFFYKLVSEGRIKKVKLSKGPSGAVRFRPADLESFVKESVR
jgi:excisionase family DNA binding protein